MDEQKLLLQPPLYLDVLDNEGNFFIENSRLYQRPGTILKRGHTGHLQRYAVNPIPADVRGERDYTKAWYKVPGYGQLVVCYFSNRTGKRIL